MRRSAITSLVGSLLLGLVVACATGTSDDPTVAFEATSVKAPTEPTEEVKLPPASQSPAPSSSTPSPAPTTSQDAGTPAQDAAPPAQTTADCDVNDPVTLLKLLLSKPSGACPCASADQCCLAGQCL